VARLQKFVIWPARERPGRRQARLEHFGEIWQFRLPRRALGAGSAGRSRSKLSSILPQSGTNTGNPAQAILPARGHSYRLATHNRCERPRPDGRFRPTMKELSDKDEVLPGNIAARARDVRHGSDENDRTWRSVASIWNRRPRGRRSSLERCLHDRSWFQANATSPCGSMAAPALSHETRMRSDFERSNRALRSTSVQLIKPQYPN
jgi:hypothetical protein